MKPFLSAALTALLLATPVIASAGILVSPANQTQRGVAGDPPPRPSSIGNQTSSLTQMLNEQDGIHLTPSVGLGENPIADPIDSTISLVNRTGGGH